MTSLLRSSFCCLPGILVFRRDIYFFNFILLNPPPDFKSIFIHIHKHKPESPGGDTPPQVDGPEPEQPDMAEAMVEEAPAQASLFGEDAPAAEQPEVPEPPPPGADSEVVVSFEKISELISARNKAARDAVEQEGADAPRPEVTDKGQGEPSQEEPAPKRRGRKTKEEKTEPGEQAPPKRRGRKPKEAAQEQDSNKGKARDKVSQGKRDKAAREQAAPGGGAAGDVPAAGKDAPGDNPASLAADEVFGQKGATRAVKEEVVYLDLSELYPFKDHSFQVREDAEM